MRNLIGAAPARLSRKHGVKEDAGHSLFRSEPTLGIATGDRPTSRTLFLLAASCLATIASFSFAQSASAAIKSYAISAQRISTALKAFAAQSDMQLIFAETDVGTATTEGVKGELTPREALAEILKCANLEYEITANNVVVIRKPLPSAPATTARISERALARLAQNGAEYSTETHGASKAQTNDQEGRLEEILVTARRREEKAQEVPVSVSIISQQALRDNNVQTLGDLQYLVPSMSGVTTYTRDAVNISIRGQGGSRGTIAYLNDVPVPTINGGEVVGGPGLLFDLENVQVLKGPQGTLFGRNSVGGALLLQTARPGNEIGGRIQMGYGNYDNREVDGAVDLPIVQDMLLARLAINGQWRDGFTHVAATPSHPGGIDVDKREVQSIRGTVVFRPTDRFQADLIMTYQDYDGGGSPFVLTDADPIIDFFLPGFSTFAEQQRALGIRDVVPIDTDPASSGSLFAASNIMRFDLTPQLAVRNIVGYSIAKSALTFDTDATVFPFVNNPSTPYREETRQFTEELQLLGTAFDERLDWIVGGFYLDVPLPNDFQRRNLVSFGTPTQQGSRNSETSKAIFAQGNYDLSAGVEGLSVTAGLRHTWDESLGIAYAGVGNEANAQTTPGESTALTWTLGLEYKVTPDTLVYLASRRGYRPGGNNQPVEGVDVPEKFGPEYVLDYELGLKSDWALMDRPIRTNIALYYQDYSDIQLTESFRDPGTDILVGFTGNGTQAVLWGAELEAEIKLTDNFQVGVNFDRLKFYIQEFGSGVSQDQIEQNERRKPVPYKYGVSAKYRLPLGPQVGAISLQANWNWQATSGDPLLLVGGEIPSFGLLNLAANWNDVGGRPFDLSFYMSNALGKEYGIGGVGAMAVAFFDAYRFGEPRMYGVRVRYNFGAP